MTKKIQEEKESLDAYEFCFENWRKPRPANIASKRYALKIVKYEHVHKRNHHNLLQYVIKQVIRCLKKQRHTNLAK